MIKEHEFKKNFLQILNNQKSGWIDGDIESGDGKKVDILNHKLKIAIEIKDDTNYRVIPDGVARTTDLNLMNQRYSDAIKSANNKFKNYPCYKTLVLFRTEYIFTTVKYAIEGLDQIKYIGNKHHSISKVGKYSKFAKNEVGGFLLINSFLTDGHSRRYFSNYLAKSSRIIKDKDIEILTGWEIPEI